MSPPVLSIQSLIKTHNGATFDDILVFHTSVIAASTSQAGHDYMLLKPAVKVTKNIL